MPLIAGLASIIWLSVCFVALIIVILLVEYLVCPKPSGTTRHDPAEVELGLAEVDSVERESAEDALVKLGYNRALARQFVSRAVDEFGATDAESILEAIISSGMLKSR